MKIISLKFISHPVVCAAVLLACSSVWAQSWTPTAAGPYAWDNNLNWSAAFPNAVDASADITGDFAGDQTISLNTAITVGSLIVGDTGGSPDSPVIIDSGTSGSLTFQTSGGNATLTTISVGTSSSTPVTNTISAPVIFNSNTTINPGNLGSSGQASRIWLTGSISGSGNITVTGSTSGTSRSTLMLSGDNSAYTGNWILSGTTGSTLNSGAGISITNDNNLGAVPGSPSTNITVTAGDNSALRFNGAVTLNANRNIEVQDGGRLTLIQDTTATSTINGIISGDGGVTTNGGSSSNKRVRLSGDNTYTGSTIIGPNTLLVGSSTALGVNSATSLSNSSQSNLDLNNFSISIGSLAGGGSNGGAVALGSGTLTSGGLNNDTSFAGSITGTGGFTKIGSGTQTFTAANTYTGATTISSGTLALSSTGSIDSSTIAFGVTDAANGLLTAENAAFAFGGTLDLNLNSVTLETGSWTLFNGSAFGAGDLNLTDVTSDLGSLTFVDNGSGVWSGTDLSSRTWTFSEDLGTLNVIPEPTTLGLVMAFGLAMVLGLRRRKA